MCCNRRESLVKTGHSPSSAIWPLPAELKNGELPNQQPHNPSSLWTLIKSIVSDAEF